MSKFITLVKKEFLEQKKTSRLLILIILFAFFAISSPILAKLTPQIIKSIQTPGITINLPDPTSKDAIDQFVKNISQLISFVLVFMLAGAIADEKSKKTLEIVLAKPINRSVFILAKFASYLASIKISFILSAVIFYLYTRSVFGDFDLGRFTIISLLLLVYLLFISSVTLMGSAISKSTIAAAGIGFAGMILFGTIAGYIKPISKYAPDYIIRHYPELLSNGWDIKFLPSAITSIILIFVFVLISIYVFKKQEVER